MRLKFKYKTNNSVLPINNQHLLNGYIHKVLGIDNEYHNTTSKYNISNLRGGSFDKVSNKLIFENEAYFMVSSLDKNFINKFLLGVLKNKIITTGFEFMTADFVEDKIYDGYNNFFTLSPIILKENDRYYTIKDSDFLEKFETYLKRVASKFFNEEVDLKITLGKNLKSKLIKVKEINNPCSILNFNMVSSKKVAEFFYYNGIGLSRGSGFGTIAPVDYLNKNV